MLDDERGGEGVDQFCLLPAATAAGGGTAGRAVRQLGRVAGVELERDGLQALQRAEDEREPQARCGVQQGRSHGGGDVSNGKAIERSREQAWDVGGWPHHLLAGMKEHQTGL